MPASPGKSPQEQPAPAVVSRPPRWLLATCFLVPLALDLWTAARTVQGGDTGELGLIGLAGGVAHPPGYPLYSLLVRAFGWLPIDPPFFRVSLASVFCGALAAAVIARLAWVLTRSTVAALGAALAFAVCPILWRLSGVPEVFTLHALLIALVMLATLGVLHARPENISRRSLALGLVFGLGLANHPTIILTAPFPLVAAFVAGRRLGWINVVWMGLAAALGLTPYLFLLSWSHLDPAKSSVWGTVMSFPALVRHVLRSEYGTLKLHGGPQTTAPFSFTFIGRFFEGLPRELSWLFLLAAIPGFAAAWRRERVWAVGLFASLFLGAVVFPGLISLPILPHTVEVSERFFVLPLVLFLPLSAFGLALAAERLPIRIVALFTVFAAMAGAIATEPRVNWSHDHELEQYLHAAWADLPPHAIVLGESDTMRPAVQWAQQIEGFRPDVVYIDVYLMSARWYFDRVLGEVPEMKVGYDEASKAPWVLAAAAARARPTFAMPEIMGMLRITTDVSTDGLLYSVWPSTHRLDLDRAWQHIDRETTALGALSEPADGWSLLVRKSILIPWADISGALKDAGRTQDALTAEKRAEGLLPKTPLQ